MAVQFIGNLGGTPPQLASGAGSTPKSAGSSEVALPQANPLPEQPSREQVQHAVEEMRKSMSEEASSNLQFAIDDDTGQTIVRVTDRQTGELIRQIPSKELVELAKSLDRMQGMLLRNQA
jgi:flagellar protein FlaG